MTIRIAYISSEYPPETGFGGIGTYTRHIAEGMAACGHDVHVFCRAAEEAVKTTGINGVTVHRCAAGTFPLPEGRALYLYRTMCRRFFPQTLVRKAWAREVARQVFQTVRVQGTPFDIVEYPECGGEGWSVERTTARRTVARLHTPWAMIRRMDLITEGWIDSMALDGMERSSVVRADAVTSPTRSLLSIMKRRWRFRSGTAVPNPIPLRAYRPAAGTTWMYTGRIERRKGVHILIMAYANLCRQHDPPQLHLVGRPYGTMRDGMDYGAYVESLIREYNIGPRVTWTKGVPHEQIPELLSTASAAVFPSLWENLPYACMEAMASGLPVVASRCGGYEEMIENDISGLLFEPDDCGALTRALRRLMDEHGLSARLGVAARERVRSTYDTAVVCPRMESLYADILEGRPHG